MTYPKNYGTDPNFVTADQQRVLDALRQTTDPHEAARLAFPNHKVTMRHARMDKVLGILELRRFVRQVNGVWEVAPEGPWRLSLAEAGNRSARARRHVASR